MIRSFDGALLIRNGLCHALPGDASEPVVFPVDRLITMDGTRPQPPYAAGSGVLFGRVVYEADDTAVQPPSWDAITTRIVVAGRSKSGAAAR
ncbi:hypothetical protein [Humisphaera borealis]|uniref:Uncharacterized protein n=1 Tax=Humisphaera borealis TaxID=2807512 RepID=A0A7M2X2J1_9BACT|nr:hypothetical protein [Humisphaera borealis]QOV91894.1 hypothetical protein IPV69_11285 [Humisphaera borealis]